MEWPHEVYVVRPSQLIGFVLWRAGLLILASYAVFRAVDLGLAYLDLPTQLDVGLGLALTGCGLVLISLLVERYRDHRSEGGLTE
ncbi:MAG: hypothetical protein GY711_00850 [bacterium]|nr:hypothetical protein [bacterium]